MTDGPDRAADMRGIIRRIEALERHSHEPFDFTDLVERLEALERGSVRSNDGTRVDPCTASCKSRGCNCANT